MTNRSESALLTGVGPDTVMGQFMRQYWIPAAKTSELTADGDPIRIMLLGEKLIAFRDTTGAVGVLDHRCPHRCASLFYGRNENNGLRCVYHGWKFDRDGNCLEMPNLKSSQGQISKVKAKSYKTTEQNGIIWVFMGDQNNVPPILQLEPVHLGEDELRVLFVMRECNWLQALEGDIDTSHFSFLHGGSISLDQVSEDHPGRYQLSDRAPDYHVTETDWGTMYGAYRDTEDPDERYWRIAQFLFPFWTMPPDGDFNRHIISRAWVPMDDSHTMFVHMSWKKNSQGLRVDKEGNSLPGVVTGMEFLPNTTDWYGRWRLAANVSNDYKIDREAQRQDKIYTGITGIHLQDQAITESMGSIVDHDWEHLAPSDRMIAQTRRRLLKIAKKCSKDKVPSPGVNDPELMLAARSGEFIAKKNVDLWLSYRQHLKSSLNPTGRLKALS
ncbi:MAG: Rieske 2Fe-2S domain-containing protein [Pseudomonadota bacterium]|nr:Rieske 2Fe-2S domain-containing protein [Pseudomonadota bacterium]